MNSLSNEQYCRLQLALSENIGPITFRDLIRYFKSAEEALIHLPEFAARGGRRRPIKIADKKTVDEQIILANKNGCAIITTDSQYYPRLLNEIEDCPPILFVKGRLPLLSHRGISIVGSRNSSINGQNIARRFAFELAENGYAVTSGLARGIDAAAHEGALASRHKDGGTIAVLGTGADVIYPTENEKFYHQIAEQGSIVSEFPMGTKPMPMYFPRRNRIIAGLSIGTLVIEGGKLSGSLITANMALSQNREVFAIPGSPADPRSEGPNQLIKDGAHLVTCPEDILSALDFNTTRQLLDSNQSCEFDKPFSFIDESNLETARQQILSLLSPEVTGINQIIRTTGLPTELVSIILVELELAGKIERFAGQKVALIYNNEWGN